jgi:hypothetical protein
MQPTSYQPAVDLLPYGGELNLVVGCGTQPTTHAGPHRIPLGNPHTHQDVFIPINDAYTMDIVPTIVPHRVGSFWIADHTEDLPSRTFQYIYFENLPGDLLNDRGWALTAARTAHRLLGNGGMLIIRAGMNAIAPGGELHLALQHVFGANVGHNLDQYQWAQDIRAWK